MLTPLLRHIREKAPALDPGRVGDIVIGNVLPQSSLAATEVRIAGLLAGFPQEVPVVTVNRQCSSGLTAIANVAAAIKVYGRFARSLTVRHAGWLLRFWHCWWCREHVPERYE